MLPRQLCFPIEIISEKCQSKLRKSEYDGYWILNTNTFDGVVEDMEENLYIRKDTL